MPTANITVQQIYAPAENGKMYRLVGDDSETYFVWADKINQYEEGGNYDLSYNDKTVAPGKSIKIVNSTGGAGGGNARRTPAPAPALRPHPVAAPKAAPVARDYPTPPVQDEHIFVSMCVKEAIRAGLLDPNNGEATVELGRKMRKAHKYIWAPPTQQKQASPNDDMNDAIPF